MRIGGQIEPGRPALNARQRDLLDRIEADGTDVDRLVHREGDHLHRDHFQKPQYLDEIAFALVAHPRLQKVTQMLEDFGQVPALQRGGLVEGSRLGLDQRQIMKWIRHEHGLAITARVAGDLLAAAQDDDLIDEALHHHVLEAVAGRNRVVVRPVAHQCCRRYAGGPGLARLERPSWHGAHRRQVGHEPLADRLTVPSSALFLSARQRRSSSALKSS